MGLLLTCFRLAMAGRQRSFEAALHQPQATQLQRLQRILQRNAATRFGKEHQLSPSMTMEEYRRAVPIRSYDGFAPYIEEMKQGCPAVLVDEPVRMFSLTSGTSATPKFCPVTTSSIQEHHQVHLLWMRNYAMAHPDVLKGKFLTMVSPAEAGRTEGDIPYGAASGRQYLDQALPVRMRHPVPYEVFQIADYATRYYTILRFALEVELSNVVSVNPSTLVLLARALRDHAEPLLEDLTEGTLRHASALDSETRTRLEARLHPMPRRARVLGDRMTSDGMLLPRSVWPNIAGIVTWQGGSAPFYLSQLDELWGEQPRRCLGLRASEGTFSIPLEDNTPSGVAAITGPILEFVPEGVEVTEKTETLLPHQLETGCRYRTIVTTSGGFYRYDLADIVEVTGWRHATPEFAFLHKAGNVLSLTGEKVTEDQVVLVMKGVQACWPAIAGFSVTLELTENPRYVLAVEWTGGDLTQAIASDILQAFDRALCESNEEYEGKRKSERLDTPILLQLAPGAYASHRAALVAEGKPDGQIKPPHLLQPGGQGPAPVNGCPFFEQVEVVQTLTGESS